MILRYQKNLCWFKTTIPIQTIALIYEPFFIYGRHIDDVITSLRERRGFEMGDHLQIKRKDPIEDFDIGHHKSAHNLHETYFCP